MLSSRGVAAILIAMTVMRPVDGPDRALIELQRQDAVVATAGHRLALANRAMCGDRAFIAGFTPHYINQYDAASRVTVARHFGLDARPSVLVVAAGSAAEQAGVRRDDRLLAVDGQAFPEARPRGDGGSFTDTERALDLIDDAAADGRIAVRVQRANAEVVIDIDLPEGCRSRFQVVPGDATKARADGTYVQISAGLIAFAQGDSELASVLAHELAHNMLRHRARLEAQGAFAKGVFGPGRRNARLIRATEVEADRLSPYLIANAGYDPRAAVRYWARHGAERGDRWFRTGTHPRWRERLTIIQAEVAAIELARQRGEAIALPPDLAALLGAA